MLINIGVKTRAKKQIITKIDDNNWRISLKSEPIENKANIELIKVIAETLSIPKSNIKIIKGLTSKKKIVKIL